MTENRPPFRTEQATGSLAVFSEYIIITMTMMNIMVTLMTMMIIIIILMAMMTNVTVITKIFLQACLLINDPRSSRNSTVCHLKYAKYACYAHPGSEYIHALQRQSNEYSKHDYVPGKAKQCVCGNSKDK